MKVISRFCLALLGQLIWACVPHVAQAQSATQSATQAVEVELSTSYQALNHGLAPWKSVSLEFSKKLAPRRTIYGSVSETSRFALLDHQFTGGAYFSLSKRWLAQIEASFSPSHRVQARYTIMGQLGRELGRGWLATVGVRHSSYNQARANLHTLGVERYWQKYRAAYTLFVSQQPGIGSTTSHSLQANYFYRERDAIGLILATGKELTNLGPRGLLATEARGIAVTGRHAVNRHWAINYDLNWNRQGDIYSRRGGRIGVRYYF